MMRLSWLMVLPLIALQACQIGGGSDLSQEEILKSGVSMQAMVSSIKDLGNHDDETSEVIITLNVQPSDGEAYPAEIQGRFSRKDLTTFVAGTTVNVKVDKNDKTAVAIVGALVNPRKH